MLPSGRVQLQLNPPFATNWIENSADHRKSMRFAPEVDASALNWQALPVKRNRFRRTQCTSRINTKFINLRRTPPGEWPVLPSRVRRRLSEISFSAPALVRDFCCFPSAETRSSGGSCQLDSITTGNFSLRPPDCQQSRLVVAPLMNAQCV